MAPPVPFSEQEPQLQSGGSGYSISYGPVMCLSFVGLTGSAATIATMTTFCEAIREFMRRGVVIRTVINNMTFDGATQDPVQKAVRDALIAFMAATAQAQAEATKAAQRAGIEHAKAKGYRGRQRSYKREQLGIVQNMLSQGANIIQIAKATGLSQQTVYRIKDDPAGVEAALAAWAGSALG